MTSEKQIGLYSISEVKEEYDLLRIANTIEVLGGSVFQIDRNHSAVSYYFKISRNQKMNKFLEEIDNNLYRW